MKLVDLIDWSRAPDWATWAAMDDDGEIYWYDTEPDSSSSIWHTGPYGGKFKKGDTVWREYTSKGGCCQPSVVPVCRKWMIYFESNNTAEYPSGYMIGLEVYSSLEEAKRACEEYSSLNKDLPGTYVVKDVGIHECN